MNSLILKLIKENQIHEEAALLLRNHHLRSNDYYPIFETLIFGDYEAFANLNKEILLKEGIQPAHLERNVKIQAIPRIVAGISVASYVQVAEILKIKKEEVEGYVIEAIQEGILKAKID